MDFVAVVDQVITLGPSSFHAGGDSTGTDRIIHRNGESLQHQSLPTQASHAIMR